MSWKITVEVPDEAMAPLLREVVLHQLSDKFGLPELSGGEEGLTLRWPEFGDITQIRRFDLGGVVLELERTAGVPAVSRRGEGVS